MPIKLITTGGGSVTLDANGTASNYTLTAPARSGNLITSADSNTVTQGMLASNVVGTGPAFRAYPTSGQSITLNTWTKVSFGTEEYDLGGNYDTSNHRFIAPIAGYYQFNCMVGVNSGTNGSAFTVSFYRNGSQYSAAQRDMSSGNYQYHGLSDLIYLAANQYVEVYTSIVYSTTTLTNSFFSGFLARAA